MKLSFSLAALVALALGVIHAAPAQTKIKSVYNLPGDPAYSVPEHLLQAAIFCPHAPDASTVLIVPGTGSNATLTFSQNWGRLLPRNGLKICYLLTPHYSLGDVQTTAEYVSYAVNHLATLTGAPIRALSHSQGGLDIQWALTFFPSTRRALRRVVALAADYRGTILGNGLLAVQTGRSHASLWQQSAPSNLLTALARAHGGLAAWVPTTNVYTHTDTVVQPAAASGTLSGGMADNVSMQRICPGKLLGHFGIIVDAVAMFVGVAAFLEDVRVLTEFERVRLCVGGVWPRFESIRAAQEFAEASVDALIRNGVPGGETVVDREPLVRAYADR